jgi:copper homeostasis protein
MALLEIAVFNIQSALMAAAAGADRLELCDSPADGGTTASYGTLKLIREKINIPVFPIIRPHGGDFCYTDEEYSVIKKDLLLCKELGFEGAVVGILKRDGSINMAQTKALVEIAYPMEITFHRAFDRARAPLEALEDIISCGCSRILTSGQVPNAFDGKELIKTLVTQAADRIIIMPGSGVRSNNIKSLATFTGATELHSSARKSNKGTMEFIQEGMKESIENVVVDEHEIQLMKKEIETILG